MVDYVFNIVEMEQGQGSHVGPARPTMMVFHIKSFMKEDCKWQLDQVSIPAIVQTICYSG